ncbi:MAG: hypothetical protein Q4A03_00810 [Rothia sp. (in: high G+C Gram-positive bacteria)]|uniref:peptidase inhibitor family I36 protein n=1 Tax=Rothia sp. (in: high G+C Gram-positive bacteria) TaxID=1885016 RepID=UPI0027015AB3|nr:hypothetical protein [Rothia sp. (in: high G+C Gram-positive bacteria)]
MKPSKITALLASFAIGSCLLVPVSNAEAAVRDSGCVNDKVCVWDHRAFGQGGSSGVFRFRTPWIGNTLNDKISSYRIGYSNTRYKYVMFYEHSYNANAATGYGPSFYDRHNHGIPYLHEIRHLYGGTWGDKISSFDEAS